eukprot:Skav214645  [mRNA]  locus=scaffold1660:3388:6027:+ [translate_table: standard]
MLPRRVGVGCRAMPSDAVEGTGAGAGPVPLRLGEASIICKISLENRRRQTPRSFVTSFPTRKSRDNGFACAIACPI